MKPVPYQSNSSKQTGFSLVELMIALVLGLLIVIGVVEMFTGHSQTNRLSEAQARIQESSRYALHYLSHDIRNTSFAGCQSLDHPDFQSPNPIAAITGIEGVAINDQPSPDTISLTLGQGCDGLLARSMANAQAIIVNEANNCNFQNGSRIVISENDCSQSELFTAAGVAGTTLTPRSPLNHLYSLNSELFVVDTITYTVSNGNLTRAVNGERAQPLVPGVQDLQIRYGVDTNGDGSVNNYQTAAAVTSWEQVIGVRLDILMQSPQTNVVMPAQTINFNGRQVVAQQGQLLRQLNATVAIRNRL